MHQRALKPKIVRAKKIIPWFIVNEQKEIWREYFNQYKDLFPYLKVPLDVRCLGMKWNHWNIICAELPTIYDSERFLLLLCTNFISTTCVLRVCFESNVNIWLSKHHIQHISVALGLFSILFSPTDQRQKPSRAGSAMETSRCTAGLIQRSQVRSGQVTGQVRSGQ